jgi:prophage endopeptidase
MSPYLVVGLAAALLGGAIGAAGTHAIDANHYSAQIASGQVALADEQKAHTADLKAVSDKAAGDAFAALAKQQTQQKQIADMDAAHQKEIADEKAQNAKLAADVAAGTVRLRVAVAAAKHSAGVVGMPATASAAGGSDGTTVELAPSARQAYFEVSSGIADDQSKIIGLQNYITNVCLKKE